MNVPWLMAQIKPFGRCETAILEQWVVPEDLSATITKEARWAEESMSYPKSTNLFS